MKPQRQIPAVAAAFAVAAALAMPTVAAAEYYVPPANSAANQYTESFPGAGGESSGKRRPVTPGTALGAGNAEKLGAKGPAGKAAAEMAAETAPPQLVGQGSDGGEDPGRSAGNGQDGKGNEGESGSGAARTGGSDDGSPGAGGGTGASTDAGQPAGSSGVSQVLGQATGAGAGNLGLWLPLVIALTLIGSIAYWVRGRNAQPGHRA
jgi:hypothetical protein